jgi:acyl-CoA dehydrogenase
MSDERGPALITSEAVREDGAAPGSLAARAARVGAEVAAVHADRVDRDAAFPREAIDALRRERLLGAQVPRALGGLGASIADVAAMCTALGRHCANTAMIFAMHHIQAACVVRHGLGVPLLRDYAAELLAGRQALLASATTEAGVGGDVRSSVCALERDGDRVRIVKNAPVISYGLDADGILVTSRRAPDAPSGDQVITLLRKEDYALEQTGSWDTLGFRGTCSNGFLLTGRAQPAQVFPLPYADISAQTMLPVSHLLWSALWLGIALDALDKARVFVRAEARRRPGTLPPAAVRLSELATLVQGFRGTVNDATREYTAVADDPEALSGMGLALRMNSLKIAASQGVVQAVTQAMLICGIASYRNDSKGSLGRHLRDAYGAMLMINNDRIHGANAQMLLVYKEP